MSIGLDCFVELKNKRTGKWELFDPEGGWETNEPFSYGQIALFTGFRNFGLMPVPEHWQYRGYPKDSDYLNSPSKRTVELNLPVDSWWYETNLDEIRNDNDFAISYVTLQELLQFDYDVEYVDRYNDENRDEPVPMDRGRPTTIRAKMEPRYFDVIAQLAVDTHTLTDGNTEHVRIIYNLS